MKEKPSGYSALILIPSKCFVLVFFIIYDIVNFIPLEASMGHPIPKIPGEELTFTPN